MTGSAANGQSASGALEVEVRQDQPFPLEARFVVAPGDVLAIFGPSGAGKTTLLRTVAGLHRPAHALVRCGATTWTDTRRGLHVATAARRVGLVSQDYALFPHLDAQRNVEAALGDLPRAARAAEARRWLSVVRLTGVEQRRPAALSGGQQQRVALARALARRPEVLLLDEPFAGADATLRTHLHDELDTLRRALARPVVLVTHSMADVRRLATHVLMLDGGRMMASGALTSVAARADLGAVVSAQDVGSIVETDVASVDEAHALASCVFDGGVFVVPGSGLRTGQRTRIHVPARDVILATARPTQLSLHNVLEGRVRSVTAVDAARVLVQVQVGSALLLAEVTRDAVTRLGLEDDTRVYALVKSVALDAQPSPA